jgi:molybdate transport system ATP-binding protein
MTSVRITKKTARGLSLDVDLQIAPGVTALYGPVGAGKTLLLQAIAGFVTPDAGRILLDDAILFDAAARVNIATRHRAVGYVFQGLALFPHMTLERNIAFAANDRPRLERHRRVGEMLERFELTDAAGLRPAESSPAQLLRCAIARALVGEPKLLLVDDAGLDESLLARIREKFANPILLVTGDLDLCAAAAGQLVLLEAGRIVRHGPVRDVLESPDSVEAARLLGIPNIFEGTIAALDPARNSSRLDFPAFSLAGPYVPGHFRGDRISIAVRADALRVHRGEHGGANCVAAELKHVSERARYVRLEFSGSIFADVARDEYLRLKETAGGEWLVEFPAESLRVL